MANDQSLKDTIYNSIMEDILSMEYRPGQILNEQKLVAKYQCSKSPVREALLALCSDHVLRNIPRYGYEVLRLTKEDIYEMMQFRYILESGMLKTRYSVLTPAHFERLRAVNEKCQQAQNDLWEHWACNTEFHLRLIGFCGNNFALEELTRCMDRLKRAYAQYYWETWDQTVIPLDTRNHEKILSCLEKQDIDGALHYLSDDLNDFGGLNGMLQPPH